MYPWAAAIPRDVWLEYVLPYANVNEARSNWRPLFLEVCQRILSAAGDSDNFTIPEVVSLLNSGLWSALGPKEIVFKSGQTPLIYDPMSVIAFGYASCTGVSITFVDALRSVGIPSRLVGTPAWNGQLANGNHNWLEVWTPSSGWQFIEALPAGGGETLSNPCDKWFCNPANFANGTQVFAARYNQASEMRYPMAWDLLNEQIPGDNRTDEYSAWCAACK